MIGKNEVGCKKVFAELKIKFENFFIVDLMKLVQFGLYENLNGNNISTV
jgi:hypothetical protein